MPGHDDEFDEERILIPPLPPSHLKGCNLIDVAYNVEVCGSGIHFFFFFVNNQINNLYCNIFKYGGHNDWD